MSIKGIQYFIQFCILVLFFVGTKVNAEDLSKIPSVRTLTQAIFMEARDQPLEGQYAVGIVILNRVKSKRYPNTINEVVFQSLKPGIYQFSYLNDPRIRQKALQGEIKYIDRKAWRVAQEVAVDLLTASDNLYNKLQNKLGIKDSMYYFNPNLANPRWRYSKRMTELTMVGEHLFMKRNY